MPTPTLALYLTDAEGVSWRVHWVCYGPPLAPPHKQKRLPIGDPRANHLYFVRADGHTRLHKLERDDPHLPDAATLAAWVAEGQVPASPQDGADDPWRPTFRPPGPPADA